MAERSHEDNRAAESSSKALSGAMEAATETLKCLVCPAEKIPANTDRCPSCGTDLRPLHRARELPQLHYNQAVKLAKAGAFDSALLRVCAALALDETFWQARRFLGRLLWEVGAEEEALRQWQLAAHMAPKDAELTGLLQAGLRARRVGVFVTAWRKVGVPLIWAVSVVVVSVILFVALGQGRQPADINGAQLIAERDPALLGSLADSIETLRGGIEGLGVSITNIESERQSAKAEARDQSKREAERLMSLGRTIETVSGGLAELRSENDRGKKNVQVLVTNLRAVEEQLRKQQAESTRELAMTAAVTKDLRNLQEAVEARFEALHTSVGEVVNAIEVQIGHQETEWDTAFANLSRAAAEAAKRSGNIEQQLLNANQNTIRSFRILGQLLRPAEADAMAVEMARLREDVKRLRNLERRARDRNWLVVDWIRASDAIGRRRFAERQLQGVSEQYETLMAPWNEAMSLLEEVWELTENDMPVLFEENLK